MLNLFIKLVCIIFTIFWTYIFGYNLASFIKLFITKRKIIIINYKNAKNDLYFGLFSSIVMIATNLIIITKVLK